MSCSEPLDLLASVGVVRQKSHNPDSHRDNPDKVGELYVYEKTSFFVNGYRVEKKLGEGTSGQVFLVCKHDSTGTYRRALKHIKRSFTLDNLRLSRCHNDPARARQSIKKDIDTIRREIAILSKVREHPHIATYVDHQIEEYVTENSHHLNIWLLKEYYPDVLANLLLPGSTRPISNTAMLRILIEVGEALVFLHEKEIIHRDIKPANILIDRDGSAKLDDFGQAKTVEPDLMQSSGQIGTLFYSAPEVDARWPSYDGKKADIFSLGAVFYECVTRRPPFAAGLHPGMNQDQVQNTIISNKINHIMGEDSFLNDRFLEIVNLATAQRPEDRYDTMEKMVADFKKLLDNGGFLSKVNLNTHVSATSRPIIAERSNQESAERKRPSKKEENVPLQKGKTDLRRDLTLHNLVKWAGSLLIFSIVLVALWFLITQQSHLIKTIDLKQVSDFFLNFGNNQSDQKDPIKTSAHLKKDPEPVSVVIPNIDPNLPDPKYPVKTPVTPPNQQFPQSPSVKKPQGIRCILPDGKEEILPLSVCRNRNGVRFM